MTRAERGSAVTQLPAPEATTEPQLQATRGDRVPSRRTVLHGAAAVGLAAGAGSLLAACGSGSSPAPAATPTPAAPSSQVPTPASGSPGGDDDNGPDGTILGPAGDVPVGGGVVYSAEKVVVTQPSAGEFRGFSAVCTHQGCIVASVQDGAIVCDCHGSHYSISDGAVVSGPAPAPLAPREVEVDDGDVVLES